MPSDVPLSLWTHQVPTLIDLEPVAQRIAVSLPSQGVIALVGEMGVGKTTLISALCRAWGVTCPVASPTFALVHEYPRPSGPPIFHIDCYRLESLHDALQIGCEEYIYHPGALTLIEWPQILDPILPTPRMLLTIERCEQARTIRAYHIT